MTPRATYRLQFGTQFGLADAANIAGYLARLGVSHVYASPLLKAQPGSPHGYDVVDHGVLNPELGGAQGFAHLRAALESNGLGLILDVVTNHIGIGGAQNPLWLDVLEWGPASRYASWFDIDWDSDHPYLRNKVLVPFLSGQYGVELQNGKLLLKFDEKAGAFAVWAYDIHKLPVRPVHYPRILGNNHAQIERLSDAFANLEDYKPHLAVRAAELQSELARLNRDDPEARRAIAAAVERFNGTPGDETSWRYLHDLIEDQHWRAAYYRVAQDDINYRRFFNINELAGLRMEVGEVFDHAHRLIFDLLRTGVLDGLRIDHVDGLLNPKEYLKRLRSGCLENGEQRPFYLVVEKILARHEMLPEDWPVDGTTGYDFGSLVLQILIDPAGEEAATRTYQEFTGETRTFSQIVRSSKTRIMEHEMTSELDVLAREAARIARQNPQTADFTHNILRRAIEEVVACFPVYRTYVDYEGLPSEADRRDLEWAVTQARSHQTDVDPSAFDFVANLISGNLVAEPGSGFSRHAVLRFAMKLQQYSGPVMAKGLEDTAFYRYNRFIALNDVGGQPDQFGITLQSFHKTNALRARRWPHSMLNTSTHDSKRGEDVRARLAVLSEIPDEWSRQVQAWSRVLRARRGDIEGTAPPDRNDEYLYYQMLVGTWPAALTGQNSPDPAILCSYVERLKEAMRKSVREARVQSNWASPNEAYESAMLGFIEDSLDPERSGAFLSLFSPFQERIARLGVRNSLVQTALKLTLPGVPDIYQGTELWDLNMVDPDNRHPADYGLRNRLLEELGISSCDQKQRMRGLLDNWQDGAVKLAVITEILAFRRENPLLFSEGAYEGLNAEGVTAERICAFARNSDNQRMIVAATRFPVLLDGQSTMGDTRIPVPEHLRAAGWREILTDSFVRPQEDCLVADALFDALPVAVLTPA